MALSVYTPTGIVHETSVDFTRRVLAEPVHLVQYDESLPVVAVTCLDAGQYMTLTASDTVSIRMDKGDGTFIYNPALGMSADGHTVYVQITLQMTTNYGRFEPVLELLRGNGYGCSSPIPLFIDVNPVPEDEIESTSEYGTIIEIRNEVQELRDETQEIIDSSVMTFNEAAARENINSGESLSTIMGKVKKWFADLKNAAFHTVANNYTTTVEGYVLDARLGPAIKEKMDLADTINTNLSTWKSWSPKIYDLNNYVRDFPVGGQWIDLGGLKFASCSQAGNGPDLSGISTMLQIRNVPIAHIIGGGAYFDFDMDRSSRAHVIQKADNGAIFIRPNVVSSDFSDASKPGYFLVWVLGY